MNKKLILCTVLGTFLMNPVMSMESQQVNNINNINSINNSNDINNSAKFFLKGINNIKEKVLEDQENEFQENGFSNTKIITDIKNYLIKYIKKSKNNESEQSVKLEPTFLLYLIHTFVNDFFTNKISFLIKDIARDTYNLKCNLNDLNNNLDQDILNDIFNDISSLKNNYQKLAKYGQKDNNINECLQKLEGFYNKINTENKNEIIKIKKFGNDTNNKDLFESAEKQYFNYVQLLYNGMFSDLDPEIIAMAINQKIFPEETQFDKQLDEYSPQYQLIRKLFMIAGDYAMEKFDTIFDKKFNEIFIIKTGPSKNNILNKYSSTTFSRFVKYIKNDDSEYDIEEVKEYLKNEILDNYYNNNNIKNNKNIFQKVLQGVSETYGKKMDGIDNEMKEQLHKFITGVMKSYSKELQEAVKGEIPTQQMIEEFLSDIVKKQKNINNNKMNNQNNINKIKKNINNN